MRLNLDILAAWLPEQWRIKQFGSGLRELDPRKTAAV